MKNVYILTLYSPEWWSWIEKVSYEISKSISKSNDFKCHCVYSWKKTQVFEKNNIVHHEIKVPQLPWINFVVFMIKLLKILSNEKIDILLDNISASTIFLLFQKKCFKTISICHWTYKDYHVLAKYFHFENLFDKIKYYLYTRFNLHCSNYVIKKSDKIITLSKYLANDINIYNKVDKENIIIIYNWYDKTNLWIGNNSVGNINILFISNDHARKGINILEWIAKHYETINNNIKFYVIWKPYNNVSNNIIPLWKMDRNDLYKLMSESEIIFLPSYCEWQPLVVLEAMWLWCIPVISRECHMDMLESTIFEKNISKSNTVSDYICIIDNIVGQNNIDNMRKKSKEIISRYTRDNQANQYFEVIKKELSIN